MHRTELAAPIREPHPLTLQAGSRPPRRREPRRQRARAIRLGGRDLELLGWLARQRFASAAQVGERFGIGPGRAGRRLGELAAAGYVERVRPFVGPSVYLATPAALALAGSSLPRPRVDVRTYRHDLGITQLTVEFELAGLHTITEREMRSREARREAVYSASLGLDRSGEPPRRHFCDLAVEAAAGALLAFELELTPKRTGRLRAILKAYRRSPQIARVVYYVEHASLARRLEELARSLYLEERLEVRWW
ncbi:MAG TPA: helix-turn-helix domain-containing protein [Gaiellaceae bacterium]